MLLGCFEMANSVSLTSQATCAKDVDLRGLSVSGSRKSHAELDLMVSCSPQAPHCSPGIKLAAVLSDGRGERFCGA